MKNIYGICIAAILISMASFGAFSQKAFYFGPDATVNVNDSVVIRLNDYQGDIQWQRSLDLENWENIAAATRDTLLFVADTTSYFRAEVIAGDCDPFYSDTTMVGVFDIATLPVSEITGTTGVSGGIITADGGDPVTIRGVVWSTSENLTIDNNDGYTTDGAGIGEFTSTLTGLIPETAYYVRAYATNVAGTGYGQQEEFATEDLTAGDGVTDIDGNFYPSVIIGNQEWMAENLKTPKYRNGTPIEYPGSDNTAWQSNTTGAYAWYHNDIAWKESYGALYNWHAVNNSNGLCPTGWHVPSHDEWTQLEQYICNQLGNGNCETQFPYNNTTTGWRGTNEGNALKSCRQVSSPLGSDCATSEHPRWNSSTHYGTDEFELSALPGGFRDPSGTCSSIGFYGTWWSSSEYSASTHAWHRGFYYNNSSVGRHFGRKGLGFSLRCVRD